MNVAIWPAAYVASWLGLGLWKYLQVITIYNQHAAPAPSFINKGRLYQNPFPPLRAGMITVVCYSVRLSSEWSREPFGYFCSYGKDRVTGDAEMMFLKNRAHL